jgi:toxin HigB-1
MSKRRASGLDQLNAAVTPHSPGVLKSVGLHMLQGIRAGHWAVTINGPWPLAFRFADGDAHDVEIVDYH